MLHIHYLMGLTPSGTRNKHLRLNAVSITDWDIWYTCIKLSKNKLKTKHFRVHRHTNQRAHVCLTSGELHLFFHRHCCAPESEMKVVLTGELKVDEAEEKQRFLCWVLAVSWMRGKDTALQVLPVWWVGPDHWVSGAWHRFLSTFLKKWKVNAKQNLSFSHHPILDILVVSSSSGKAQGDLRVRCWGKSAELQSELPQLSLGGSRRIQGSTPPQQKWWKCREIWLLSRLGSNPGRAPTS